MFPRSVATHGFLNSPKSVAAVRGRLFQQPGVLSYEALLDEARMLAGDEGRNCPKRYSDEMVVGFLNRGLHELSRIRPDAFYDLYGNNNLNVPEVTSTTPAVDQISWTAVFQLNFAFWPPLVYYVVSQMDMTEDEYTRSGGRYPHGSRAAGGLRLFRKHVLSV